MVELIIVLFAILAVITPFLTLYLLGKYKKLRTDLDQIREVHSGEFVSLHREVADLKKQLATAAPPVPSAAEKAVERPVAAVVPPVKETPVAPSRVDLPAPVKIPSLPSITPASSPILGKRAEPPLEKKPQEPALQLPASSPITPASTPYQKPPAHPVPAEPPPASKPTAPTVQPPAQRVPPLTPRPTVEIPPTTAARVTSPPPVSAFRVPAPKATLQQRMKAVSAIEEALGTNWLNKLGIIILVVGVALFGIYELGTLGPLGKVGISYFASLLLLAGGISLEKRERYRLLGRTGIGGGWALLFFSTYGMYHVGAMRVFPRDLEWLTVDCALMLLVAVAMALHTLRYRSQFVTGLAFLLGYFTVGLSQNSVYSLFAGVFLAIGLVSIVLKMGWFELEVFGILSTYLTHLYWLYRLLGINGAQGHAFPEYHASLTILFFYWLIFRISYVARSIKSDFEEHVSTAAAVLSMFLLLGCLKFQSVQPELAYIALFAVGAAEFICAQIPVTKRRREAFIVLTVAGAALMLAAVPAHYAGHDKHVTILWLVGTEVFLIAGVLVKEIVFRRLGVLTGLLVGIRFLGFDFRDLVNLRLHGEQRELGAGVLFAFCAVVFYLNNPGLGSRWKEFFDRSPDRPLLTVHSYLGAFAAATAVGLFSCRIGLQSLSQASC